jgi:aminoglycoside phosphotransferase (APT) family kinase protein
MLAGTLETSGGLMSQAPPPDDVTMQRSSRDVTALPPRLARWLAGQLPDAADPSVSLHPSAEANGLSSETLPLDVTWTADEGPRTGHFVARLAPAPGDLPVFPDYELRDQYEVMRLVGERTDVPVPRVRWLEPTGAVIGTPFFLMDRVDGDVPPDVMPYNFGDNWLYDATPEQQRRLQDATVDVIARIHGIPDAASTFAFLDRDVPGDTPLERDLARTRRWYEYAVRDIGPSPLVERALAWLGRHLPEPAESSGTVLSWGDSRIGNVLYREFEPVGVLDWEMATTGPRELDVSWLVFAHQVFESLSELFELPGMPGFLREEDVVATYERITGVRLAPLRWFHVRNATQWCIVFMRTGARQIHFGEIERPDDIESLMHCKPLTERLLDEAGA